MFFSNFLETIFSPIYYKVCFDWFFMENVVAKDIGEEIIVKLRELNKILKEMIGGKYEEERTDTSCIRNLSA